MDAFILACAPTNYVILFIFNNVEDQREGCFFLNFVKKYFQSSIQMDFDKYYESAARGIIVLFEYK